MDLEIADLFPERSLTSLLYPQSLENFRFARTVVTGGAGSIGSALVKMLIRQTNSHIWILDNDESRIHTLYQSFEKKYQERLSFFVTDIRDKEGLHSRLEQIQPDLVIHAAALKHVSILEAQPRDAFFTNVIGTQNLIDFIRIKQSVSLVFVSSDKAANPRNILGKTKLIGEHLVSSQFARDLQTQNSRCLSIVRFGNVFLSRGSVLETFLRQIELGEPVTITDPRMTRYFMDISEAATLIIYVINEKLPGVSVFKMGEPLSIHEVAVRLQKKMNAQNMNIEIIGLKPGEKIHEDLFTQTEEDSIQDLGLVFNSMQLSQVVDEELITLPKDDADALKSIDIILSSAQLLPK